MSLQIVHHELDPVFNGDSKVLILGTIPSPKSRLFGFYYSHPQNKFWKVIANVFREAVPETKEEKVQFLIAHDIAMWDVLQTCGIEGADDSSIVNPTPNNLNLIIKNAKIRGVFTTGKKATDLYKKLCYPQTGQPSIYLPSTSPANCRNYTLESLVEAYRIILEYL